MIKKVSLAEDVLKYGNVIKINNFITQRGMYTIRIVEYENKVFFHKMLNGEVVECVNIGKTTAYRSEK